MPVKTMGDYNTHTKALLGAAAGVTSLVPVARILRQFPTSTPTFPLITYNVLDSFHIDSDYQDNVPAHETVQMEIHSWNNKGSSATAVAVVVNTAMVAAGWSRFFGQELIEPDTGYVHYVARYVKRFS